MLLLVLLTFENSTQADQRNWQQFKTFGGSTLSGEVKTLIADTRYLYAFTGSGGVRYDKLLDKWDFSFLSQAPPSNSQFAALDHLSGDFYFVSGQNVTPYNALSKFYYGPVRFPAPVLGLSFDGKGIWAKTQTSVYSLDRWTRKVSLSADSGNVREWQGIVDLRQIRTDVRLLGLAPYQMMDEWAVPHPITALANEQFGPEVWLWYRGLGLWKYNTFSRKLSQATKGFLASAGVNAIASHEECLALAGPGGITLVGAEGERWQQINRMFNADLAEYSIRALVLDDRDVFAGTDRGILAFKRGDDFVRNITTYDGLPYDRINCLYLEGDSLWAGTDCGLGLYQRSIKTTSSLWPQLENHKISGIGADSKYIYLATARGAVKLDRQDSLRPRRYTDPDPALLEEPMTAVISEDTITWWLGSDFLLAGNKNDGSYRTFLRSGNYAAGQGLCLAIDAGNVWIGTDNGLVRFVKSRNQFLVYHAADGLMDEQVWSVYSLNGYLWAGGANGVSRFCFKNEDQ
ncbi:hypothetical protein HY768_04090 [candidate division TA06 bacterium]|uniref:Two component regulator propeller n=1 Tax=candidate division TA06 bacterium TaxID=2250710 RepID=A0A933I849_UNCT6|nr:hypothetical protein [candidate division TA06 bacterium]